MPDFHKINFDTVAPTSLSDYLGGPDSLTPAEAALLEAMLRYQGERRIAVRDALLHDYFWEEPLACLKVAINV